MFNYFIFPSKNFFDFFDKYYLMNKQIPKNI